MKWPLDLTGSEHAAFWREWLLRRDADELGGTFQDSTMDIGRFGETVRELSDALKKIPKGIL